MKKTERLNWIIMTLRQRGKMSASQLAAYMEVSPRTIYRDMMALGEIQVPVIVHEGSEGGYEIDPSYFLPILRLREPEILVLLVLLKFADHLHMGDLGADTRTLGHKLLELCQGDAAHLAAVVERIHLDAEAILPEGYARGLFSLMIEAFRKGRQLEVTYFTPLRGDTTTRTVTPLGLFWDDGGWYLQGHCHLRGEHRTFRLDRIREARLLDSPADERALNAGPGPSEPLQTVLMDMDPRLYDLIRADEPMRSAQATPLANGRLAICVTTRRMDYFHHLAFRNIDHVLIREPASLVESIRATLAQGISQYSATP